ncbi:hypothetical protein QJS66_13565 [Kocuria rhizophila]|nr:hypothetical protein QJS66_13565 [Kocuria rhizophila]
MGDRVKVDQVVATIVDGTTPSRTAPSRTPTTTRIRGMSENTELNTFELSEEYQALARRVRSSRTRKIAPVSAKHDEEHSFPVRDPVPDGGPLFGLLVPGGVRGQGGHYFAAPGPGADRPRGPVRGHHPEAGVAGAMPVYLFGTQEQSSSGCPSRPAARRSRVRAHPQPEAGSDAGGTRTRAELKDGNLGDQRQQGVHHQLRHGHHQLVTVTAVTGTTTTADGREKKDISPSCPHGHPRFHRAEGSNKVGWNASDLPATFEDVTVPELAAGPAGPRLRELPADPGRADRHCRPRHGCRAGLSRRGHPLRHRA